MDTATKKRKKKPNWLMKGKIAEGKKSDADPHCHQVK